MKVTVAALADYASISMGDKLNVLGVFDTVWTVATPAAHPKTVLVIRTLAEHEDSNRVHPLEIRLEDEDGQPLFRGQGEQRLGDIPPGETAAGNLIIELNNLPFPRFGRYSCVVTLDGAEVVRLPLKVAQLPQPPST